MTSYFLPPEIVIRNQRQLRKQGILSGGLFLVAGIPLLIILIRVELVPGRMWIMLGGLYTLMVMGFVWYYVRTQSERLMTYQITLEKTRITLQEGGRAPRTIERDQITEVYDLGENGLLIKTERIRKQIFVMAEVEGYESIRDTVSQWKAPEPLT